MIGAACLNEIGGYKCQCRRGFVMNSDQTECIPKQPIHKNEEIEETSQDSNIIHRENYRPGYIAEHNAIFMSHML